MAQQKQQAQAADEAMAATAELFGAEGLDTEAEAVEDIGEATAAAASAGGPVTGRSLPPVEYTVTQGDKTLYPVRYLPRALWPFIADPAADEAFLALYQAANVALQGGGTFNVIENALLTTGQRSLVRLMALLPATNPEGKAGFEVSKDTAARSWVYGFQGTDPAVPFSGQLPGMVCALEFCEGAAGDKVVMPSNLLKNRVIMAADGSTMTAVCGGRTTLSWGNTKADQVYVNFGAAAQERADRPVAEQVGRFRHILKVARALSFVDAVSREHEGGLERERHLLAMAGLRNVYYGRPKGSKDSAKAGLQATLSCVVDPRVNGKTRENWKTEGAHVYRNMDVNIG